jgi:DNA-binding Lrp family transcriptional regulator
MSVNPWEVLTLRRRIKKFEKLGIPEASKALHRLRSLGIDRQMIVATEVTRTLVWVCNRTKDSNNDEQVRKFNVMVRFLIK